MAKLMRVIAQPENVVDGGLMLNNRLHSQVHYRWSYIHNVSISTFNKKSLNNITEKNSKI